MTGCFDHEPLGINNNNYFAPNALLFVYITNSKTLDFRIINNNKKRENIYNYHFPSIV